MALAQRYKDLHLGQLRAFCACVRQRSFSAAARSLAISQPTTWQQVRALERQVGVALLQRRGRELEPSEDGQVLFELAASILGSVDSLQETFARRREHVTHPLRVVGSPGVLAEELARPIAEFCRRHPHIRLTLLNQAGLRTLDLMLAGEADLAVLPLGVEAANRKLLAAEHLCERKWVVILPHRHPLARRRMPSLNELVRYPLILPERESNWRKRVDALFLTVGLLDAMQVVLESSATLTARRFVSLGVGIAVLPMPGEVLELPGTVVRPLDLLTPEEIGFVWRRGSPLRPQARLFADFLKDRLAHSGRKKK